MARVAKTMKENLVKAKIACIGKKMKGFKFADCKSAHWHTEMEDFIGLEAEVIAYNEAWNYFTVKFSKAREHWAYPATRALKYIVEEPKVVEKNVLEEAIDDTYTAMLKEEIADLSARLDGAYKEQEEMLEELGSWLKPFPSAFTKLQEHAGVITPEDVTYHTNLILRIMEHKFGYKPKMVEL
jgi:hypothetical protein